MVSGTLSKSKPLKRVCGRQRPRLPSVLHVATAYRKTICVLVSSPESQGNPLEAIRTLRGGRRQSQSRGMSKPQLLRKESRSFPRESGHRKSPAGEGGAELAQGRNYSSSSPGDFQPSDERMHPRRGTGCDRAAPRTAGRLPANRYPSGSGGLPLQSLAQAVHRLRLLGNPGPAGRPECSGPSLYRGGCLGRY